MALRQDSVERLKSALEDDEGAIDRFFFGSDFEPVLCCAVRLGCGAGVVSELLRSGADVSQIDKWGHTPLQTLASADVQYDVLLAHTAGRDLAVARVLVEAGADPRAKDRSGRPAWAIAKLSGKRSLALFLEFHAEALASAVLLRAQRSAHPSNSAAAVLAMDVLPSVIGFLLPQRPRRLLLGGAGLAGPTAAWEVGGALPGAEFWEAGRR